MYYLILQVLEENNKKSLIRARIVSRDSCAPHCGGPITISSESRVPSQNEKTNKIEWVYKHLSARRLFVGWRAYMRHVSY